MAAGRRCAAAAGRQEAAKGRRERADPAEGNRIRWIPAGSDEGGVGGELHGRRRSPKAAAVPCTGGQRGR